MSLLIIQRDVRMARERSMHVQVIGGGDLDVQSFASQTQRLLCFYSSRTTAFPASGIISIGAD